MVSDFITFLYFTIPMARICSEGFIELILDSKSEGIFLRALVLTRDGLQIADTVMPTMMPGEVRIEVRSVGICRSDIKAWKGEAEVNFPLILGQEISGIVHESTIPDILPGTPVTTEVDISCGVCWFCRNNKKHLCTKKSVLGLTRDGGLAEYISVPSDLIHVLPDEMDHVTATFVNPVSSAIETYTRTTVRPKESVLIIGTGKVGLIAAQVFDAFGAEVFLLGDNQWHMGVARQLGFRNLLYSSSDWKRKIRDATKVGPHVVVEATGSKSGLDTALEVVRSGGTIALTGHQKTDYEINPGPLVERGISIIGTLRGDYKMALDLLNKGRIEVHKLVSKEFPLEQGAQAFEEASKSNVVKVIINI